MKKNLLIGLIMVLMLAGNLFAQQAIAQVNNYNEDQPNTFAKHYGTKQMQPTRGATDALVYIDYEIEDGKVLDALTALGYSYVVAN